MKTCLEFTLEKNIIEYIHFFLGVLHSWGKCNDSSLFHHCKFYYVWYLSLHGKPVLKTGVLQCDKFYCHYKQLFHVYETIVLNNNECTHFEYMYLFWDLLYQNPNVVSVQIGIFWSASLSTLKTFKTSFHSLEKHFLFDNVTVLWWIDGLP